MAGSVLAVVSVLLFAASWALFDAGQPGAPLFPDARPDYGFDGRVTIYLPPEAKLTGSSLNVSYGPSREFASRGTSTQRLDVRVDYLDVEPIESANSNGFRWKAEGDVATLRVRSSYVDINGEALAQRLLFLSGVVVGLASACAPYAVQSLFAFAIHRWRSAARSGLRALRIRRRLRREPAE